MDSSTNKQWFVGKLNFFRGLFKPSESIKSLGLGLRVFIYSIITLLVVTIGLMFYWDTEPDAFTVSREGQVVGQAFTESLIKTGETLLNKRGGYLSNDVIPPSVLMDNIPNWEFGALVMLRDGSAALRNHFSRSQSQSVENKELATAEPQFNFQNDAWIIPSSEGEYEVGIERLKTYNASLGDTTNQNAQFFARADNLVNYLVIVEKRLGSLSQRLSASVGSVRSNTDLAGDGSAQQSTESLKVLAVKTSWSKIDDVFYEARGTTWALLHQLKGIEADFKDVLNKKNAMPSVNQIIRELEVTQEPVFSPMILNGRGFGLTANYSLVMANYISRANAAIIDLRSLLERG
ncbi:MAG: DUF2333 family protein [Cycloclasticus sp.]|nr:DUF2333 family protein [Cycloclasticus sp.]